MRTNRIIDNKKIRLTPDEFKLYQEICKEYDRQNFKGSDLFRGLFETDDNGIIIFLRPPRGRRFTMEVIIFLLNVMVHQHLGTSCDEVDIHIKKSKDIMSSLEGAIKQFNSMTEEGRGLINDLKKCREKVSE